MNENSTGEMDYGVLRGTTEKCSFLNEENLCQLQLKFGHESLCNSCRSYPRINNLIGTEVERSLAMSCPEVIRILCSIKEGLDFEIIQDNNHYNIKKYIPTDIADIVFTIRLICIELMQDKNYSIEKRLKMIGCFIEGFVSKSSEEQLFYLQEGYSLHLAQQLDLLNKTGEKLTKIKITDSIVQYMLDKGQVSNRYIQANASFSDNFFNSEGEILKKYENAEYQYNNYFEKYSYQMENILVNLMFQEIFPFNQEDILESYCILLIQFGILKSKLLNQCIDKPLTNENFQQIIQTYFKAFDHNGDFIKNIYKIIYKGQPNIEQAMQDFLS